MCSRFIRFFGGIHNNYVNRIMTDFGLTDEYRVHDSLDQREVGNSQSATQHILNVASEFFDINNISINNDKTVAIFINCKIADPSLLISELPIYIAKRGESHHYLGIYLLTEGLSKPSLAKAHSDIWFFANLVFKKAVSDKQFSYLVLAVLFSIIGYRTQFSYVPVLCWHLLYPLQYPVYVKINPLNNFLAGMMRIFSRSNLSLGGSLTDAFCHQDRTSMSCVLDESTYFKCVSSLWHYGIAFMDQLLDQNGAIFDWKTFKQWKQLDPCGPVPACAISANLLCSDIGHLSVYMDGFLSGLGSVDMKAGAAVFFENISMDLGVGVSGLMSSTLTELQAIVLALKCNEHANELARAVALSNWNLPYSINKCYFKIGSTVISGNSRHFVQDVFQSVHHAHWEIGSGSWMMVDSLRADIDWFKSLLV
ncbi:hypothetical protein G9A89_012847 [Geosiphon pyriformis]|nr:hypothetical protein G9A89_012847 [Geosiphon pyriformis]